MSSRKPPPAGGPSLRAFEDADKDANVQFVPLPSAPPCEQFYKTWMTYLETILCRVYLMDLAEEDIVLSICVLDRKPQDPVSILFLPAVLAPVPQTVENIVWNPKTIDQDTLDGLYEMFCDLGRLVDELGLKMILRRTESTAPHLIESNSPEDMLRLLEVFCTHEKLPTLDDIEGRRMLGPRQTIMGQTSSHIQRLVADDATARKTPAQPFIDDDLNIEQIPPETYLSAQHAFVALNRSGRRGVLPISLQFLRNILAEERGLIVAAGQGLHLRQ